MFCMLTSGAKSKAARRPAALTSELVYTMWLHKTKGI